MHCHEMFSARRLEICSKRAPRGTASTISCQASRAMTKSVASLFFIAGAVSLAGACSSSVDTPNGGTGATGNTTGGTSFAGTTGTPTAGNSTTAGTTGTGGTSATGGAGSVAGSGTTGGTAAGGTAAGGTAGTAAGGMVGTGGMVNPGEGPPGYWVEKDWHGCAWTGKGAKGTTTVTPMDFVAKPPADAFCIAGSVGAEPMYESVALLGFNVGEAPPASCAYKPADTAAAGPPSVVPTGEGLAVNFVKRGADTAFTLRVQIQGPNGHKDGAAGAADRWCATITEVQGKIFVPYSSFTPSCWETVPAMRGTPYAKQPISAVVFNVPGKPTATPYDFCVNGFTYGATAAEAPDGPAVGSDQKGTVGIANVNPDGDFARAKVVVDGEQYIIQNNNWGNPSGTDLILSYTNNSFKLTSGSGSGADAPASFPSIYIGNNGNTANGVYSTKTTDKLPIQISAITSLPSTFRYSGSTAQYNATYDIWFANSIPTTEYKDGIDGFVMIWLRDPTGKQPIGSKVGQATVAGQVWDVWVGPRGDVPGVGYNDAPVVSFLNPVENDDSRAQTFKNVDLKAFFTAAQSHGISASMYLTDVFGGFEIWQGGSGGNLGVDEFKAVVNP
jgi:Glycosyl hydrolase family 12